MKSVYSFKLKNNGRGHIGKLILFRRLEPKPRRTQLVIANGTISERYAELTRATLQHVRSDGARNWIEEHANWKLAKKRDWRFSCLDTFISEARKWSLTDTRRLNYNVLAVRRVVATPSQHPIPPQDQSARDSSLSRLQD